MRIGIDAMGGDFAPVEEIKGALAAREHLLPEDRIVLFGRKDALLERLSAHSDWESFIEIVHCEHVITMNEKPVEAIRVKPQNSMSVMTQAARDGLIGACVSAGNTGAFVAAAQMNLRRLKEVHRPGIAVVTPTYHGPVVLCDVGANVACRPQHLHQYGVMSSIYSQRICGIASPRVGLLSIGEEDAKGNDLVRSTRELLRDDPNVNFIGNVEGRDLFRGTCDVMVCDGFVGNVILKLMEGMIGGLVSGLLDELKTLAGERIEVMRSAAKGLMTRFDFNEYGGAPLLGVGGICIICHGASDWRGFKNAVRVARQFVQCNINDQIMEFLAQGQRVTNG
ncbi:MAG: phosphate acyltransferase PlsX [Planctomycetes bacterium]|nr:phosphate acyltransferase PlsX [Planctomycetota bacterium]